MSTSAQPPQFIHTQFTSRVEYDAWVQSLLHDPDPAYTAAVLMEHLDVDATFIAKPNAAAAKPSSASASAARPPRPSSKQPTERAKGVLVGAVYTRTEFAPAGRYDYAPPDRTTMKLTLKMDGKFTYEKRKVTESYAYGSSDDEYTDKQATESGKWEGI